MALDNKISNVFGTALPQWLKQQIRLRSKYNSNTNRDDLNVNYLANKTAWLRVISSVNINSNIGNGQTDLQYFQSIGVEGIKEADDLAKKYALFAGTSQYLNQDKTPLRSGVGLDGAYGMLGDPEIKEYGYRPMPGITDAKIETQGRLGSIRMATINFKVWDKMQLDIIDSLYFKLGYTMLIEWGQTVYIKTTSDPKYGSSFEHSEFSAIDPFQTGWTKEKIQMQLTQNCRQSEGNYDGMLGIVTNFTFAFNQEGGYDCMIKVISLGALGDSTKINNPSSLPDVVKDQIKQYIEITLKLENQAKADAENAKIKEENAKTQQAADADKAAKIAAVTGDSYFEFLDKAKTAINNASNVIYQSDLSDQASSTKKAASFDALKNNNSFYIPANTVAGSVYDIYALVNVKNFLLNNLDKNSSAGYIGKTTVTLNLNYLNSKIKLATGDFTDYLVYDVDKYKAKYWETTKAKVGQVTPKPGSIVNVKTNQNATIGAEAFINQLSQDYEKLDDLTAYDPKVLAEEDRQGNLAYNGGMGLYWIGVFGGGNRLMPKTATGFDILVTWINYVKNGITYRIKLTVPNTALGTKLTLDDAAWNPGGSNIKQKIIEALHDPAKTWLIDVTGTHNHNSAPGIYKDKEKLGLTLYTTVSFEINKTTNASSTSATGVTTDSRVLAKDMPTIIIGLTINDAALITGFLQENVPGTKEAQLAAINNAAAVGLKQLVSPEAVDAKTVSAQVDASLKYQSNLELAIKSIELYALTKAVSTSGLNVGNEVKKYVLSSKEHRTFFKNIFKYGIFKNVVDLLADDKTGKSLIKDDEKFRDGETYINNLVNADDKVKLKLFAKYGMNSAYMAGQSDASDDGKDKVPAVNYNDLTSVYVVPYAIDQSLDGGAKINHPVYLQLGFLLMILNDMCTIYEEHKSDDKESKPLVYIDYNPETNFCLTNPLQFTSNAFDILIPFQANVEEFKTLFPDNCIDTNNNIMAPSDGAAEKLFDPKGNDAISANIPPFRAGSGSDAYRGKTMKILISCEYIINLIDEYAAKDGMNSVYLKPFLEQIVKDINNYLGGINIFRIAYNDAANSFCIVDDQVQPLAPGENAVKSSTYILGDETTSDEMPVYGKNSIATSLNIQTEMSSKIANVLAISANSVQANQSSNSTNASSVGFINSGYKDRYIPVRKELSDKEIKKQKDAQISADTAKKDSMLKAAQMFNIAVKNYYGTASPSKDSVMQATNYYIERMSKSMNDNNPTKASAIIPLSVNFTTNGISGFNIGQAFTLPPEIMPYTYSTRQTTHSQGLQAGVTSAKVAFAVVGINHIIQNNVWMTALKGGMIMIKDQNIFNASLNSTYGKKLVDAPPINLNLTSFDPNAIITGKPGQVGGLIGASESQEKGKKYAGTPQVPKGESITSENVKTYYPTFNGFKKGTSDIVVSNPLSNSEIVDKTYMNPFKIGLLQSPLKAFIIHHTADSGNVDDIIKIFLYRGFPAQYIIGTDGTIYRYMPDGLKGQQIMDGWGAGIGLNNSNTIGVEVIAAEDKFVTDAQIQSAKRLAHYLGFKKNEIFSHGEVNPGHKSETEGKIIKEYISGIKVNIFDRRK
jgi:hypothetical protein